MAPCTLVLLLSGAIIVDACSIERNRILVSCYCVGGPNEKKLPPHCLIKVGMYFYKQISILRPLPHFTLQPQNPNIPKPGDGLGMRLHSFTRTLLVQDI